jgi:hypothetical protein
VNDPASSWIQHKLTEYRSRLKSETSRLRAAKGLRGLSAIGRAVGLARSMADPVIRSLVTEDLSRFRSAAEDRAREIVDELVSAAPGGPEGSAERVALLRAQQACRGTFPALWHVLDREIRQREAPRRREATPGPRPR